jgi:hypothetical protein
VWFAHCPFSLRRASASNPSRSPFQLRHNFQNYVAKGGSHIASASTQRIDYIQGFSFFHARNDSKMLQVIGDIRPYLEAAYFFSGVLVAAGLAVTLKQINLIKSDIIIKNERWTERLRRRAALPARHLS